MDFVQKYMVRTTHIWTFSGNEWSIHPIWTFYDKNIGRAAYIRSHGRKSGRKFKKSKMLTKLKNIKIVSSTSFGSPTIKIFGKHII